MSASWFNEGYETVDKVAKDLDERMNQSFLPAFKLADEEEAKILFLTTVPVNYYQHYVKSLNRYFTCSQQDCPFCDIGNKPSYTGAYLVFDTRYEEWEDKKDKSKKSRQNTLKLMTMGIKALKQIKKQETKRGLDKYGWEVTRTGKGTDTSYSFIPLELDEVATQGIKIPTAEEIKKAKEDMFKQIAPMERAKAMDLMAGRTAGSTNSSSTPSGGNGGGFAVENQDPDEQVLRFV